MYNKQIIEYLKSKNVNPLIIGVDSPVVNWLIFDIENSIPKDVTMENINPYLAVCINVDTNGNVMVDEGVSIDKSDYYHFISKYEMSEDGKFIRSVHSKHCDSNKKNEYGRYDAKFRMVQYVYDEFGIEINRTTADFEQMQTTQDEIVGLVKNDLCPSKDFYTKEANSASKNIKEIKRNYDIGSAYITLTGSRYLGNECDRKVGCTVQLYGEHLNSLEISAEAESALNYYLNHSTVKSTNEFIEFRKNNPSLEFSSSDMKQEQQDKYYDWLNWEAGLVYNNLTKNRIKQLITERGLISSRQKQADAMVEAMANGTLDVNGNEMANQSDMVSSYTRTMGFGGIWLLGLITGILSCGMIILGVFLR